MSYDYKAERPYIFTEEGSVQFLRIRDNVHQLLNMAGAVRMDRAISGEVGSTWEMLACVDRLVELGEIKELTKSDCAGQYRIFTWTKT